jgi:hypothetical protein
MVGYGNVDNTAMQQTQLSWKANRFRFKSTIKLANIYRITSSNQLQPMVSFKWLSIATTVFVTNAVATACKYELMPRI